MPSTLRAVPDGTPAWTPGERALLRRLSTPRRVQDHLDGMSYRLEDEAACPRRALAEKRAHCFDGALLAAAALRRQGHPPRLVGLWADRDDGHILAVFQARGGWGAVAKSNFAGLRYRDPVYRTLRELVMSYFEDYFNLEGEKSLRSHTAPLDLRRWDRHGWETRDAPLPAIHHRLTAMPDRFLLTRAQVRALARVDRRAMEAGMVGTLRQGAYGG